MSKKEKIEKGINTIEKVMKILADKFIHKPHDHLECFIQNNKKTGNLDYEIGERK